jgi:hypothetical protein
MTHGWIISAEKRAESVETLHERKPFRTQFPNGMLGDSVTMCESLQAQGRLTLAERTKREIVVMLSYHLSMALFRG